MKSEATFSAWMAMTFEVLDCCCALSSPGHKPIIKKMQREHGCCNNIEQFMFQVVRRSVFLIFIAMRMEYAQESNGGEMLFISPFFYNCVKMYVQLTEACPSASGYAQQFQLKQCYSVLAAMQQPTSP